MKGKLLLVFQLFLIAMIEIFFICKIVKIFPLSIIVASAFIIISFDIFIYLVIQDHKRKETFKEYY